MCSCGVFVKSGHVECVIFVVCLCDLLVMSWVRVFHPHNVFSWVGGKVHVIGACDVFTCCVDVCDGVMNSVHVMSSFQSSCLFFLHVGWSCDIVMWCVHVVVSCVGFTVCPCVAPGLVMNELGSCSSAPNASDETASKWQTFAKEVGRDD